MRAAEKDPPTARTDALVVVPERRAYSFAKAARFVVPTLPLAVLFAALTTLLRGDPWRGAVLAFAWLPAWVLPQASVLDADAIRREPVLLLGWRRRHRLNASQIIARRGEVAAWFLTHWRGHPAIEIRSASGDVELVCPNADARGPDMQEVLAWLETGSTTP